jgi:hypothetical protein
MKPQMSLEELILMRDLNRVIRQEVRYCQIHDRPADVEKVYRLVCDVAAILVEKVIGPMGHRQLRVKIQHALKRTVVDEGNAAANEADAQEQQPELDFANMEEFRGIPPSIAYAEPEGSGHIVYVPYAEAIKIRRDGAVKLQDKGIVYDVKSRQLLVSGNAFADSLMKRYGDLPVKELVRLWRADGQPGAAMTGGR